MSTAFQERLAGRRVVASISGGKDSAAMALHLRELGIPHDKVFLDTGWENDATYDYLRGELTRVIGPITEISGPLSMEELIKKKGMFPSKRRRFCTEELKFKPMAAHLRSIMDGGNDVVNTVGIRRAESEKRSKMTEWEWSPDMDCEVWRPLVDWTEDDVIAIHHRHGLRPNPNYLAGASRVGCDPCIYARKSEIRLIAEQRPERIDRLRQLEADVSVQARARYDDRVARWRADPSSVSPRELEILLDPNGALKPFHAPSWFQAPLAPGPCRPCAATGHTGDVVGMSESGETVFKVCGECGGTGRSGTSGERWPIDKVVAWAKTAHGGRQADMFAATDFEAGCVRWGLCDVAGED